VQQEPLVIMVTSAVPKEGKTTSSANLAVTFAEAGSRVLVLNCDFRRPRIQEFFDVPDEPRRVHRTQIPNVMVVTNVVAEPDPNPARVTATQRHLINAAKGKFDVVILDTAPILGANDAIEIMADVDLVLIVARAEVVTAPAAHRAIEALMRVDAPLVGIVLNGSEERQNTYYAYYQNSAKRSAPSSKPRRDANGRANGNGAHPDLALEDVRSSRNNG
jgi:capsular exopolysaccharide synthesis family protein